MEYKPSFSLSEGYAHFVLAHLVCVASVGICHSIFNTNSDLVQGVALSTTAVMPFRFFAQTPFFSVSPSSFSLSPIWKYHHHHTPFCLLIVVSNASASFCQWLLHLWGGDQHRLVHLEPLGRAESGRCRTEILREIRCLLETKGSSCKESRPKHHPATSNRSDAMRWALKEYR